MFGRLLKKPSRISTVVLLLRIGKRKTTWEDPHSLEDILELEFCKSNGAPDLELSVYEVAVVDVPMRVRGALRRK